MRGRIITSQQDNEKSERNKYTKESNVNAMFITSTVIVVLLFAWVFVSKYGGFNVAYMLFVFMAIPVLLLVIGLTIGLIVISESNKLDNQLENEYGKYSNEEYNKKKEQIKETKKYGRAYYIISFIYILILGIFIFTLVKLNKRQEKSQEKSLEVERNLRILRELGQTPQGSSSFNKSPPIRSGPPILRASPENLREFKRLTGN
jgi:hypothetical protein